LESFESKHGKEILLDLVSTIQSNSARLSEIDGAIGDGDHGINMNKGFTLVAQAVESQDEVDLASGLDLLGTTLFNEIGGAMGPLYGNIFMEMAGPAQDKSSIDRDTFGTMLAAALEAVQMLGDAKVGDKTLVDTLAPANEAYQNAVSNDASFSDALSQMIDAAEKGKESTRDLVAKIGRASRLGERSRGHLDAGATSCYLILKSMADSINKFLQ